MHSLGEIGRQFGMSFYEPCASFTLDHEGGYSHNPSDPGGETNFGISKRTFPNEDIKNMTRQRALALYHLFYWRPYQCGKLSWPLSLAVFDFLIMSRPQAVIVRLQRTINHLRPDNPVCVDGVIGPQTIQAANKISPVKLAVGLTALRQKYYSNLSAFKDNGKGWMRRLADLYRVAIESNA